MKTRTGVITGGAKGIGRGIAENLAAIGIEIALVDLDEKGLDVAVSEIRAKGGKACSFKVDVTEEEMVGKVFAEIASKHGGIDILVNSAATSKRSMVEDMTVDEWRKIIEVNLTGTFICCKAALPHMIAKKFGRIVNLASTAAKRISYHAGVHYTASKTGVLGLTRHLAYEVAPFGITVNAICPGATATPLLESHTTEAQRKKRLELVPLGRPMQPKDHANLVTFLVSDAAEAITGQAIDVDGGSLLAWVDYETYRKSRKLWLSKRK